MGAALHIQFLEVMEKEYVTGSMARRKSGRKEKREQV